MERVPRAVPVKLCGKLSKNDKKSGQISLLFSGCSILLFLGYAWFNTFHFAWKEDTVHNIRYWETADELTAISFCPEGCVHLRVGRAIIKMTREEFIALTRLTDRAARELQFFDPGLPSQADTGH